MQAFSSFSWMPDFMQSQHHDKMACTKPHPTPVVRIPLLDTLKRKRNDSWRSPSPTAESPAKRQRTAMTSRQSSATPETTSLAPAASLSTKPSQLPNEKHADDTEAPTVAGEPEQSTILSSKTALLQRQYEGRRTTLSAQMNPLNRSKAIEKIEAQINLEILLKHNELRLIEQELAKCQVALEQVRRCQVIPYPGHADSIVTAEQISNGTGTALEPATGLSHPEYPAPWGVTDGPYTRHYARWLIPDTAFDPAPPPPPRQHVARKSISGRAIRRPDGDKAPGVSTRAPRTSIASPLYALPSNYPVPKDRNSPLIATRPSDGRLVKLVCKFCGKDNVSSMQGFLNHCRIQHKHEYTSHGAAADDCGVPVEEGEILATSAAAMEPPTPVSAIMPSSNKPLVHPYIVGLPRERQQSAVPPTSQTGPSTPAKPDNDIFAVPQRPPTFRNSVQNGHAPVKLGHGPFIPSTLTPSLSALLQRRGASGNLQSLVESAKDKTDFDNICEQLPSDDEEDEAKPGLDCKPAAEQKPGKPRQTSKPKPRRPSVQQSRASSSTTAPAPLRIKITTKPGLGVATSLCESPATFTPTTVASASSTFDFAHPNFGPVAISLDAPSVSPLARTDATPTRSEQSPMSINHLNASPQASHDEAMLEASSPHTIDTDPGLVSDDGDEEDDDLLTYATSSVNGEEADGDASSSLRHNSRDVDVKVRSFDGENGQRRSSQDLGDHQADGIKSPEAAIGLRGREGFVSVGRGGRRGGRGRPRGGVAGGTGRGKGGARRTKPSA